MLAPIVQRRPFPAAVVGTLGALLYVALLLLPQGTREIQAAPKEREATPSTLESPGSPEFVAPPVEKSPVEVPPVEIPTVRAVHPSPEAPLAESEAQESREPERQEPQPLESLRGQLTDELGRSLTQWGVFLADPTGGRLGETDAAGRFEFRGVQRGEYSLLVWNPSDLRAARTSPVSTTASPLVASRVTCRLPDMQRVLEGRIRTASGRPLIGVHVSPVLPAPQAGGGRTLIRGDGTLSLDEGHLLLRDIPSFPPPGSDDPKVLFWIQGGGVFPALLEWEEGGLFAEEGAELSIEWVEGEASLLQATHLVVFDAGGRSRKILRSGVHRWSASWDVSLAEVSGTRLQVVVPLDVVEVQLVRRTPDNPETRVWGRGGLQLSDTRETRVRLR